MELVVAVEISVLLAVIAYLLYSYAAEYVPGWVNAVVYVSWLSSFSIVLILPIDIYYSLNG